MKELTFNIYCSCFFIKQLIFSTQTFVFRFVQVSQLHAMLSNIFDDQKMRHVAYGVPTYF